MGRLGAWKPSLICAASFLLLHVTGTRKCILPALSCLCALGHQVRCCFFTFWASLLESMMSIYTEINLTEFQIYKNKFKSVYLFKPNSVYLARRAKVRELIAYVSNSTSLANIWSSKRKDVTPKYPYPYLCSYLSGKKKIHCDLHCQCNDVDITDTIRE